jgi:hypothetical protein
MSKPVLGQQVSYHQGTEPVIFPHALSDQPFVATVVHVNDDSTVNLLVADHLGNRHFVPCAKPAGKDGGGYVLDVDEPAKTAAQATKKAGA